MVRVAVLDDHPAVLAGVRRLLACEDDLVPVAAVDAARALFRELERVRADVVVLDYDLARGDGLAICQRLKERVHAPRVVIYSAYAGPALAVTARLAGADALVDKRAAARELLDSIRRVSAGDVVLPEIPPGIREGAVARLDGDDVAIAAMRLAGTSLAGIAEALGFDRPEVARRMRRIVGRLQARSGARSERAEPGAPRTLSVG